MRSNRAALAQVTEPPTLASNFSSMQKPAEYGSGIIVTDFLFTIVYASFQLPNATGVAPGATSGI
jgi:hypothetical protein